jgi:hypothetical protein
LLGLVALAAYGALVARAAGPNLTVHDTEATTKASAPAIKTAPAAKANETPEERLQRLIATVQDQLSNLQTEEVKLNLQEESTVGAAAANVDKIQDAPDKLFNNKPDKGMLEYKAALQAAIGQWQIMAGKYAPAISSGKALEKEKAKAPEDLAPAIDQIVTRVKEKERAILDRLGSLSERGGMYAQAVQFDLQILNPIPKDKWSDEKKLIEKICDLYFRMGDGKDAYTYAKWLYDNDKSVNRGLRAADCLDRARDFKAELSFLNGLLADNPGEQRLKDKIKDVQKKVGASTPNANTTSTPSQPATGGGGNPGGAGHGKYY